jgi:hypothetical protein
MGVCGNQHSFAVELEELFIVGADGSGSGGFK